MEERGVFQGFRIRWYKMIAEGYGGIWSIDYPSLEEAMEVAESVKDDVDDDYQIMDALKKEIVYDSKESWR